MNLQDLRGLLDYHYWARDRMLDAVAVLTPDQYTRDLRSSFRSIRDTLVHLYSAEWAWYERWHGRSPSSPLDAGQFPAVEAFRAAGKGKWRKGVTFSEALGSHWHRAVCAFNIGVARTGSGY